MQEAQIIARKFRLLAVQGLASVVYSSYTAKDFTDQAAFETTHSTVS